MFWRVLYDSLQRLLRRHRKQAHKFDRIRGGWRYPESGERCGGWWTLSQAEPCPEQADQCWITRDPVTLLTGRASCCILPSINAQIRPGVIWAEETCNLRRKGRECYPTSSPLCNPLKSEWSSIQLNADAECIFHFLLKIYILFIWLMFSSTVTFRYRHIFVSMCTPWVLNTWLIGVSSTMLHWSHRNINLTFSYISCIWNNFCFPFVCF